MTNPLSPEPAPVRAEDDPDRWVCQTCMGNGELVKDWDRYLNGDSDEPDVIDECPDCNGTGWCEKAVLS